MDRPLMNIKEVAELYQVHPRTISRWVKFGILPAIRVKRFGIFGRGSIRFRQEDVTAMRELSALRAAKRESPRPPRMDPAMG